MRCATVLPLVVLFFCCYCITPLLAQQCSDANTNYTSGFNSDCPNGRPYCMGSCFQCSAYALDRFYCDCPSGQGCMRDYTKTSFSKCGTYPKYGASCSQDSDCTTTYSDPDLNINLPCVQGKCRYCDPVADVNVTHVCDQRQAQYPTTKICVSPGVWGVAGQSTSTTAAAVVASTTSVAAGAGGSTNTSEADR